MGLRLDTDAAYFAESAHFPCVSAGSAYALCTRRGGVVASSLEKKQIDELLAKYRTIAEREQRRVDELEEQNAHFVEAISSTLTVPASAFGMSYVRAYYSETASISGIPIDATGWRGSDATGTENWITAG